MRAMDAIAGSSSELSKSGSKGSERSSFGWVYHLGVNSIGHQYCHLRFLFIRGKYVSMYKRDPHENPAIVCSSTNSFISALLLHCTILSSNFEFQSVSRHIQYLCHLLSYELYLVMERFTLFFTSNVN